MTATASNVRAGAAFAEVAAAPKDPILGLTEAFQADPNPRKVNLGVGVYQNGEGKVPLLATVREAQTRWLAKEDSKTYLPIDGAPAYNKLVQKLLLGADSPHIAEGRAVTIEGLGGTGSLKVGADFLAKICEISEVWLSAPTWENHNGIFEGAGFKKIHRYPYYNAETHQLDFDAMIATLDALPPQSLVVLHACCHNPTGVDLAPAQWDRVVQLFQERALLPFLDFAYQGFAVGIDQDAYAVRAFAAADIPCLIANSFSKSFSLYRERVGALTVLAQDAEEARRVLSQIKRVIRTNYSSPASHGAQVVATILAAPELTRQWEQELTQMRERIHQMRALFVEGLQAKGIPQDFRFITKQQGMFSFSGLSLEAVHRLRSEYGIYIVDSGRICVAALNANNIGYVCAAIADVL